MRRAAGRSITRLPEVFSRPLRVIPSAIWPKRPSGARMGRSCGAASRRRMGWGRRGGVSVASAGGEVTDQHEAPSREAAELGDGELVLRTRSGDRAAFGELWRRHYRSGISVARNVSPGTDSDDLVQEAYTRIYQSILRGGGPTGSFRAYLFTSIRNTAAAWGRGG